jgi:RNA polymerase sigma-70 factor (ECF subfamily)
LPRSATAVTEARHAFASTRLVGAPAGRAPGSRRGVRATEPGAATGAGSDFEHNQDWFVSRLDAARLGDNVAFADVYRDTQPRLFRYAVTLVGREAEDVTAEAWLQIARDLRSFTGDAQAFRAWAATVVRNRAIDQLRSAARRPVVLVETIDLERPSNDDTEGRAADSISTAAALELIATLPRDQAEAVLLRAVIGLDAIAAGKVLGKRPGAVRVAAHRGLRTLGKLLDQDAAADLRRPRTTVAASGE